VSDRGLSLYLKNTTVALVMIVPWLIIAVAYALEGRKEPPIDRPPPSVAPDDQPPIIIMSEARGYTFRTGSADLSDAFAQALDDSVAPRIAELANRYRCNVVEIVGHTDGQPVGGLSSLDVTFSDRSADLQRVVPGSNADLGLMRAWAVKRHLTGKPSMNGLQIQAMSAGALILPGGPEADLTDKRDRPERRRIEIRLRRTPPPDTTRPPGAPE
jgi:outer membrane protein OmpA-like peptidoglycan-associated protein